MITPLDIENKKFSKQMMNGYSVDEVDDFLDEITEDYGKLYKENNEAKQNLMKSQSDELQAKYDYLFRTKILDFYKGEPIE